MSFASQFGLKLQTADAGQPDIENQAAGNVRHPKFREFAGRAEQLDPQAYRSEKTAESLAHRGIVIDDEDDLLRRTCGVA